jgi:hypothetical protein
MKPEDMQHLFSRNCLIRNEISTLIGLLLRNRIDYKLPSPDIMQKYITETETLLEELQKSLNAPFRTILTEMAKENKDLNPFASGKLLREPIFYSGESAYEFQYRDFSILKYENDNEWLRLNKGFSIQDARDVVQAIGRIQNEKWNTVFTEMRKKYPEEWTYLPGFSFTLNEIASYTGNDIATIDKVLTAFAVPADERNKPFGAFSDFNAANVWPLIKLADDTYILFYIYTLAAALYESPFYWMSTDKTYIDFAMRNRGLFTEEFSFERFVRIFGRDNVYSNVDIFASDGNKAGEIDVLVLFGNRAIVLQAKSKRLTIESRKGNDLTIKDDFKKSIQDSCDQAYKCAKALGDSKYKLRDGDSREISNPKDLKDIYVLCVISDHYPALSFQARQFLTFESIERISPPFILDIFTLDAMTEMLDSPLKILSYIDRRTKYSEKLFASHELTILSYHLKRNLWLSDEYDFLLLEDDIAADLEVAMLARRDGIQGKRTPDGILTRFASTSLGYLVKEIEARPDQETINLGYMLLTLGEETVKEVSNWIDELSRRARLDGENHNMTIALGTSETGLTVHCNNDPVQIAGPVLRDYIYARKYKQQAQSWYGICVHPYNKSLRFCINLDFKWQYNEDMDALTQEMAKPHKIRGSSKELKISKQKVNPNAPCPCGSGKKYKKCCHS